MTDLATHISATLIPLSANGGRDSHGGKPKDPLARLLDVQRKVAELARLMKEELGECYDSPPVDR